MSDSGTLLVAVSALVAAWAMFQLSGVVRYNYHLYRLTGLTDQRKRRRLGGLCRAEPMEIPVAYLIESLKTGTHVPDFPRRERWSIVKTLAVAIVLGSLGTVQGSTTVTELAMVAALPVMVVLGSLAITGIHVVSIELRLWRTDEQQCEDLYEALASGDSDRFPLSFP